MSVATGTKEADLMEWPPNLSVADRKRYAELLKRRPAESKLNPLPLDEAIELYVADVCGIGRVAELAGVTRWDVLDRMKERGIPQIVPGDRTAAEMDALANELRREGMFG